MILRSRIPWAYQCRLREHPQPENWDVQNRYGNISYLSPQPKNAKSGNIVTFTDCLITLSAAMRRNFVVINVNKMMMSLKKSSASLFMLMVGCSLFLISGCTETITKSGGYSYNWGFDSRTGTWRFQNNDEENELTGIENQNNHRLY